MKVLFIGGTGVITTDTARLAIARGMDVTLLNRGNSRLVPDGAKELHADVYNSEQLESVLGNESWDVILDSISFLPNEIRYKLDKFRGRYQQYILISSSAVYKRGTGIPITEDSPIGNFDWDYGANKALCEAELRREDYLHGCRYTIIRPSETYNDLRIPMVIVANPLRGGYTMLDRIRKGKPIVVHDDGSRVNNMTHARDIAKGIVGLFMNEKAFGQAFNVTSDEILSWKSITEKVAEAAGAEPNICYIPAKKLIEALPVSSLGDTYGVIAWSKSFDGIYSSEKIKRIVPDFKCEISFDEGIRETVRFYDTHPEYKTVDEKLDAEMDRITQMFMK